MTDSDVYKVVDIICLQVVRGKYRANGWEVWLYRWHKVATIVLSGTAGAGLTQKIDSQWFWGGFAAAVAAVVLAAYQAFEIDAIAIDAIAARDACKKIVESLIEAVEIDQDDPIDQLETVRAQSKAMANNFYKVLADHSTVGLEDQARNLATSILRNKGRWVFAKRTPKRVQP